MSSTDAERKLVDEDRWPTGGTPLAAGVQPAGFGPVTKEILAEVVRCITSALRPEKIILFFGSYVWGTPSSDSDVDLLVIMETNARPADRYMAVSRLIRPRPFPLDIVVRTPDEIAQALEKGDSFIYEIMTQDMFIKQEFDRFARHPLCPVTRR
jgi:predicted nucleotidyltransferase